MRTSFISLLALAGLTALSGPALSDQVVLTPVADTRITPTEDRNFNTLASIAVYHEPGNVQQSLVQFDLSAIPSNATIVGATLKLTESAGFTGGGQPTWAFRVTQPWSETQATGIRATSTTNWTNAGGDYVGVNGVQAADPYGIAFDSPDPNLVFMDVKSLVREWVAQVHPNNGLLLTAPNGNHHHFWAREPNGGTTAAQLTIDYTVPPKIIHVRPGGDDNASGLSWANAKATAAAAANSASSGDQVWVAAGTYAGGITIRSNTRVYGGFEGDESSLTERNPATNETILQGGNSVVWFDPGPGGVLDGFTVTGGVQYGIGANNASVVVENCKITQNQPTAQVTIFNGCPSVVIRKCEFSYNRSSAFGGALLIAGWGPGVCTALVDQNRFHHNTGVGDTTAVRIDYMDHVELTKNVVEDNGYANNNGGVLFYTNQTVVVRENTVRNNTGVGTGGLTIWFDSNNLADHQYFVPDVLLEKNTISGNVCAGIYTTGGLSIGGMTSGRVEVRDNLISGNRALEEGGAGGVNISTGSETLFTENIVTGNRGGGRGGVVCYGAANLTFTANEITLNEAGGIYTVGGFLVESNTPNGTIDVRDNTFQGNLCPGTGGTGGVNLSTMIVANFIGNRVYSNVGGGTGGFARYSAPANVLNNHVIGNETKGSGGASGMFFWESGGTIANNLIVKNLGPLLPAGVDPGMALYVGGNGIVANNTISDNRCRGIAVNGTGSHPVVNNLITYNQGWGIEYWSDWNFPNALISYNHFAFNAWGAWNVPTAMKGTENYSIAFAGDRYLDRANNDYRLKPNAASINFGSNAVVDPAWLDLANNARIQSGTVDVGAYEQPGIWDPLPPTAGSAVTLNEDTPTTISIGSDSISGLDLSKCSITSGPAHGALSGALPNPTYTPAPNYFGADSIQVKLTDNTGNELMATINITVNPVNDAPVADPKSLTTTRNLSASFQLTGSDVEASPISFTVMTQPAHGTLSGVAPNLTYLPENGYSGPDSFTYIVNDGSLNSQPATVSITVSNATNRPPAAKNDTAKSIDGAAVVIPVLANDTDPDGDPLTVSAITQPLNGTAVVNPDYTVTYTPNAGYIGTDSFTYTASDGRGGSMVATVSLNVTLNRAPRAMNDNLTTAPNTPVSVNVLANDTEPDGDPMSVIALTQPANGTINWLADGSFTYTPNAGFRGRDTCVYTVSDGRGGTATATVAVQVK